MRQRRDVEKEQKIALGRVKILFKEADACFNEHPSRSHTYVEMARKIAMKVNLSFPVSLKRKFCSHCYKYLCPGVNCRVRTREGKVVIYCKMCKHYRRIPISLRKRRE